MRQTTGPKKSATTTTTTATSKQLHRPVLLDLTQMTNEMIATLGMVLADIRWILTVHFLVAAKLFSRIKYYRAQLTISTIILHVGREIPFVGQVLVGNACRVIIVRTFELRLNANLIARITDHMFAALRIVLADERWILTVHFLASSSIRLIFPIRLVLPIRFVFPIRFVIESETTLLTMNAI
jgi:hypothetical protein